MRNAAWLVGVLATVAGCAGEPATKGKEVDDGIRVTVTKSEVSSPTLRGHSDPANWQAFAVTIRVANAHPNRQRYYKGWRWKDRQAGTPDYDAFLTDEFGNRYEQVGFKNSPHVGASDESRLLPGESFDEVLLFDIPVPAARKLTLHLPGKGLSLDRDIEVEVPHQ